MIRTLFAAAVATLSINAFAAGEGTPDYPMAFHSTLTRAEVQDTLIRARSAGHVFDGERSVVLEVAGPTKTRAQVVAETLEAIRVGAIDRSERSIPPSAAQLESIRLAGERALRMASI